MENKKMEREIEWVRDYEETKLSIRIPVERNGARNICV